MKLTTENSNTTTKWRAPYIVHYIRDRERFRTQLMAAFDASPASPPSPPLLFHLLFLGSGRLDVAKAHYCPHRRQIEVWMAHKSRETDF